MENRQEKNTGLTVQLSRDKEPQDETQKVIYLQPTQPSIDDTTQDNYRYRQSVTKELITKLQLARRTNECLLIIHCAEATLHAIQQNLNHLKESTTSNEKEFAVYTKEIQLLIDNTLYRGTKLFDAKIILREQLGTTNNPKVFKIDLKELTLDMNILGLATPFSKSNALNVLNMEKGLRQINIRRSYLSAQYQQLETHLESIFLDVTQRQSLNSIEEVNAMSLPQKMNTHRQQTRKAQVGIFTRKLAAFWG